jgi:hypothetical protein
MTKAENERKAILDLHDKISQLFKNEEKRAHDKLANLINSGAGVAQDHLANNLDYLTPIQFMEAYKRDSVSKLSSEVEKVIKNYQLMM